MSNMKIIGSKQPNSATDWEPLFGKILVNPEDKLTKSAGGIIIPDTVVIPPSVGDVVSVAKDCKEAKIGDKIMFSKDAGIPLSFGGKSFLLMREEEIMLREKKII